MPGVSEGNFIFDTIAIVGVGLIGGSLGMAAKRHSLARHITGIGRSEQKLMQAQILGAIDNYSLDFTNGASNADLVVICTPVRMITPTIANMANNLKDGAIVTDVGSTKLEVVTQANKLMPEGRYFIGGHPMAGKEQAGVEAAFPDLFLGATYVLTPTQGTNLIALGKLTALIDAIGANVETMTPEEHDEAAAIISHLPHALAAALLQLADTSHKQAGKTLRLAAGSFKDLTRISDSPPELWRDICVTNTEPLLSAISGLQDILEDFKKTLEAHDERAIEQYFEQAHEIRQTYLRATK